MHSMWLQAARPGLSQERDLQVQRKTEELFLHVAYFTAPYVAAIVATIGRRLSGMFSPPTCSVLSTKH